MTIRYAEYFPRYLERGIGLELIDPELGRFDIARIAAALEPARDRQFQYLGLQTLYDRYFLHAAGTRFELPQAFFMRVAMGLAMREIDREARAIEFYNLLSSFDFMASTPTLFNCGHAQAAALELFPHDGGRRPRRHLQGHQGQCAAGQVFGRPRQ
jgi:ribonucleoside-diphosphate reductase alpha chain